VAHGAPLFVENLAKETPCDSAEKSGHSDIALYLESKMVFSVRNELFISSVWILFSNPQIVSISSDRGHFRMCLTLLTHLWDIVFHNIYTYWVLCEIYTRSQIYTHIEFCVRYILVHKYIHILSSVWDIYSFTIYTHIEFCVRYIYIYSLKCIHIIIELCVGYIFSHKDIHIKQSVYVYKLLFQHDDQTNDEEDVLANQIDPDEVCFILVSFV